MAEVMVAGRWLAELPGTVTDLKWSTTWGDGYSGPRSASWSMSLPFDMYASWLVPGASVGIYRGGVRIWNGVLAEPVRGAPWQFNASGLGSLASNFAALTGTSPTTVPNTAITQAISRGLAWKGATGFSTSAYGESTAYQVNRLDVLLDDYAEKNRLRWGVDVDGMAFVKSDPTAPTYILDAHDATIGISDESLYTAVVALYVSAVTGVPPMPSSYGTLSVSNTVAVNRFGMREYVLDLTKLGGLTSGTATTYANAMLNDLIVPAWVNRLEVDRTMLRTMGGNPADLANVQAGQSVRLFGVRNNLGREGSEFAVDVVLGEVEYEDGADTLTLAPIKLADRTFADVLNSYDTDSGVAFKWR